MNDGEQERFRALFDMFETEGWHYLMADIEKDIELLDNVMSVNNRDDLYFRKGALATLTNLKGYAAGQKTIYEVAQEQGEEQ